MKIRDKLIVSFLLVVFLFLVSILIKFVCLRQAYKHLSAVTGGGLVVDESEGPALRTGMVRRHLAGRLDGFKSVLADTASLLVLASCSDMRASIETGLAAIDAMAGLPRQADAAHGGDRPSRRLEQAMSRLITTADIFVTRPAKEYSTTDAYRRFKGGKPDCRVLARLLGRFRRLCVPMSNVLPLKELADRITALRRKVPRLEGAVASTRERARAEFRDFQRLAISSGVPGVGEIPVQLQVPCLDVSSASGLDDLRKAWEGLGAAFRAAASQIPPPTAHPMVGKISGSFDELRKAWRDFVQARASLLKHCRAESAARSNFVNESVRVLQAASALEDAVIGRLAGELAGNAGLSRELAEEIVSALSQMPDEAFLESPFGTALAKHYEKRLAAGLYDGQVQDLTTLFVLFALGVVLAVGLGYFIYRDVAHPIEVLKNSLNNLSMGGEKRRINVKFNNEFASLIEAYNRYLDNLTSTSKRLVECPNCRNPYEMGDSFCRQCGRKLRFDT